MPRSPEIKYVKRENRKKARQSEWPWVRSKKHERGKRRELFLFEGSEDAIDLENDGLADSDYLTITITTTPPGVSADSDYGFSEVYNYEHE